MTSHKRRSSQESEAIIGSRRSAEPPTSPVEPPARRAGIPRRIADVGRRVAPAWRRSSQRALRPAHAEWQLRSTLREEAGAATAEYAMVALGAVGLAGLLIAILRSDEVRSMLTDLISRALTAA